MFNKLDIVARIETLLKIKKITATQFAIDMGGDEKGYSKDTVYTWRNNRSTSYMNDLQEIADYLKVSASYLLIGEISQIQPIIEGARFFMDKEARGYLKELTWMFEFLRDWKNSKENSLADSLSEWGITQEGLHEWCVSNFENPPSKKQLKDMFTFCKQNDSNITNWDKYETIINDYIYQVESTAHTSYTGNNSQTATLRAEIKALTESNNDLENRLKGLKNATNLKSG